MNLVAVRPDLVGNPAGMVSFQHAFLMYLATQGYKNFVHMLVIDEGGVISCAITPDLNNTQADDLTHQLQVLKSVTTKIVGTNLEYVFA